jgi:hypothetical protein
MKALRSFEIPGTTHPSTKRRVPGSKETPLWESQILQSGVCIILAGSQ